MRAPALVGIITALHILAITAFIFIQGCGTTSPTQRSSQVVEQPPTPVLPPRAQTATPVRLPTVKPQPMVTPPVAPPSDASSYAIQKGDTLSHVAKRFGVSTRELIEVNNLSNPNSVRIGQEILIPPHARSGGGAPAPAPSASTSPPVSVPAAGGSHVVLAGDSLSKIASKFGVTVADLMSANGLTGSRILVGDTLTIPGAETSATSAPDPVPAASTIADTIDVRDLTIGETETPRIPVIEVPESPSDEDEPVPAIPPTSMTPQNKPIPYTVLAGDTLDEIAKLFIVNKTDIMELNGLGPDDTLTPPQVILIPPTEL